MACPSSWRWNWSRPAGPRQRGRPGHRRGHQHVAARTARGGKSAAGQQQAEALIDAVASVQPVGGQALDAAGVHGNRHAGLLRIAVQGRSQWAGGDVERDRGIGLLLGMGGQGGGRAQGGQQQAEGQRGVA
ncbi:hypothetical protein G6F22_018814 [Rhizopus arrhizus]|nr:hypothetical protein G6F22_018814 [Rhizopus arrhizus]